MYILHLIFKNPVNIAAGKAYKQFFGIQCYHDILNMS